QTTKPGPSTSKELQKAVTFGILSPHPNYSYRNTSKTSLFPSSSSTSSRLSSQPFQNTPQYTKRGMHFRSNTTQTISNVAGILRTLHNLYYDSFETIETFQQRFTNLAQQITYFTKTPQDTLQAIFARLLLNAIGRVDLSVEASLENNINSKLKRVLKDHP